MYEMILNDQWVMHKKGDTAEYKTTVPTTMYKVLFENGVIEDPFYGENDQIYRALSDDDYIFRCAFEVKRHVLEMDMLELVFYGIDTLSTISLNDKVVAATNNMHRTYRFEVADYLKEGINVLTVALASPTAYISKEQAKDPLWGVTSTIPGYAHLRKAHHMFGWDWGPQLPDMGIWRDVVLYGYDGGTIEDVQIIQNHQQEQVSLDIITSCRLYAEDLSLKCILKDEKGCIVSKGYIENLSPEDCIRLTLDEPNLWWPNGYGQQYLYTVEVMLMDHETCLQQNVKKIGLRTMNIHREKDPWGETFDFEINGIRIFAMGADYIPEDVLITRPTAETTRRLISDCAKANYNCLRVWGGGFYPSDTFYDLCDEYGLIVWQDFMFACAVYRLTKKFQENITAEFIDNIRRIRHHACLGLWCGNNEMEWGFDEWDIPKDERLRLDYLLMYEKLIPDVLADYDPQTFYWPASPSSGGGFLGANDDSKGDVHYWQVFHGNEHYKKFRDHYFRFASEYGMQAFPDMKTIGSFLPEGQHNVFSPVMENHNKCTNPMNGNVKVLLNMCQEFRLPGKMEDQVYISQVFQGETIKCAVEHFRRNRGRCMGSTYWQVNDNYPVTSWASIDHYGRWKAMHYMARRFYAQVLLSAYEEGSIAHLHITNDRIDSFAGTVKWQLRMWDGEILENGEVDVTVKGLNAMHVFDVSIEKYMNEYGKEREIYLAYQLQEDGIQLTSETLLFVCHKAFRFQQASVVMNIVEEQDKFILEVSSDRYVKSIGILTETLDLIFSDNFFDILPGETRRIEIQEVRGDGSITKEAMIKDISYKSVNTIEY